ncbi:hypothetical protein CROQUDRAFT_653929 [Cronartium quercuum f. sp. fusiforme G11]|uniref:Uncharacterized protein n=1 Tax=Cronartium quercuum f. sp. fusiforme G11 TaxID=708437 RepID=A0A9P6NRV7_9BASI|nr:hypothetical protein CROQUDRAFT_653929 [Cronartium quercuum f. sp. fusiforme G11]
MNNINNDIAPTLPDINHPKQNLNRIASIEIMGQIKSCHTRGLQKKEVVPYIQCVCNVPEFIENQLKTLCKEMGLNW